MMQTHAWYHMVVANHARHQLHNPMQTNPEKAATIVALQYSLQPIAGLFCGPFQRAELLCPTELYEGLQQPC